MHSFGLTKSGSMTDESFTHFLNRLSRISTNKGTILRIKAVLSIIGEENKIAFHAVMDACDEDQLEEWTSEEERSCKIVFIGQNLDKHFFVTLFENSVCA